jgi:hypothetical protein
MQLIGKPFDEALMLRVARVFERETQWHGMRPAMGDREIQEDGDDGGN